MKIKQLFPMLMMVAAPTAGAMGQSKSGLDLTNLDKTARPADEFYQFATVVGRSSTPCPRPTAVSAVSTCCRRM